MNISTALASAAKTLQNVGIAECRKEASSLMAFALQKDAAALIAHPEYELSDTEAKKFAEYLDRRAGREPFQYIVGHQEFYGLDFEVSPDVLIPRPETEILVECAIGILSDTDQPTSCEVGVGSGCISVSILHAVKNAKAVGIDTSEKALAIALRNAKKHNVDGRLMLQHSDVFGGLVGSFDLIVSNPPYIPAGDLDSLQAEVRDFEPRSALDGGTTGLSIIEKIILDSPDHLKHGGALLVEIGFDQAAMVGDLFDTRTWNAPEFLPDLQGIPRIVKTVKK